MYPVYVIVGISSSPNEVWKLGALTTAFSEVVELMRSSLSDLRYLRSRPSAVAGLCGRPPESRRPGRPDASVEPSLPTAVEERPTVLRGATAEGSKMNGLVEGLVWSRSGPLP